MKLLNGSELAGFIKERQAKQVRALRQSWRVIPKLAIIQTHHEAVSDKYVAKKIEYADDILVETEVFEVAQADLRQLIKKLNEDESIHGIIVQLPIENRDETDEIVNLISPEKDVDGLGQDSKFTPATAMAIDWLMAGYSIELFGKKIVIVGRGRLVGRPLAKLWLGQSLNVHMLSSRDEKLVEEVKSADVLVSAVGKPGLITATMVKPGAVIVDAGTADAGGAIKGDVDDSVRSLDDISITPIIGGVGPLTIAALIDNVLRSARSVADASGQKDIN